MNYQDKIFAIADKITIFNFESIWQVEGLNMETQMDKKEVGEEMFFKGIAYALEHLNKLDLVSIDEINNGIDKAI